MAGFYYGGGGSSSGGGQRLDFYDPNSAGQQGAVQRMLQREQDEQRRRQAQQQFGFQTALANQAAAADAARQAAQLQLQREQMGQQTALEQQRINLSSHQNAQREGWRQRVFGEVQNTLRGINDWRSGYQGKGPAAPVTQINAGPVWTDQQVNERVNAQAAQADQAIAAQNQKVQNQMAARGYGTKSPLAMAMERANFMAGLGQKMGGENDLRWAAAQGNAQHVLNAQRLMEQQRAALEQEDIERGKVSLGALTSALGTMGGLFV